MTFEELCNVNVNEHKDHKGKFDYLSWTWAWQYFKTKCPDATYEIKLFDRYNDDGEYLGRVPYIHDKDLGFMVFTEMTANGETKEMWLPVTDNNNKTMKTEPYTYKTSGKEMTVKAATMFDINTAIMRCLVKNMAMFGLGLYIYAGEDLPKDEEDETPKEALTPPVMIKRDKCSRCGQELKAITKEDGEIMPVGEVAKFSKNLYGKVLCEECMRALSKGATK